MWLVDGLAESDEKNAFLQRRRYIFSHNPMGVHQQLCQLRVISAGVMICPIAC
jgi:hypothetical protein